MFEKTIGFIFPLSLVATVILLAGKITGDLNISWLLIPYPLLIMGSIVGLSALLPAFAMSVILRNKRQNEE